MLTNNNFTFTNSGAITASSSGGTLIMDTTTFTNSGAIDVSNGDTVTIDPTTSFTNLPGTTLTGGAYAVDAGSVLELANNAEIVTDDANITLSGKGSLIQSLNTTTGDQQTFGSTLRMIGKTGQLHLLADRSLTTAAAAITDNGLIQLGGGTLKVTGTGSSLTIGAAGELEGFGVVDATTLTNSGLIEASGGTLDFQGAVTGTGAGTISGASTLEFGSAVSSSTTVGSQNIGFTGGGTLDLTDPKAFWGEISGFATTDAIELLGSWAFSGISEASRVTTLTLMSGSTTHAFDFVGDYAQGDFKITSGATSTITHT